MQKYIEEVISFSRVKFSIIVFPIYSPLGTESLDQKKVPSGKKIGNLAWYATPFLGVYTKTQLDNIRWQDGFQRSKLDVTKITCLQLWKYSSHKD